MSDGFIDECDTPGWDTWVDYYEHEGVCTLLCYVPESLVEWGDAAVEANATQCLAWIEPKNVFGRRPDSAVADRVIG